MASVGGVGLLYLWFSNIWHWPLQGFYPILDLLLSLPRSSTFWTHQPWCMYCNSNSVPQTLHSTLLYIVINPSSQWPYKESTYFCILLLTIDQGDDNDSKVEETMTPPFFGWYWNFDLPPCTDWSSALPFRSCSIYCGNLTLTDANATLWTTLTRQSWLKPLRRWGWRSLVAEWGQVARSTKYMNFVQTCWLTCKGCYIVMTIIAFWFFFAILKYFLDSLSTKMWYFLLTFMTLWHLYNP